MVSLTKLIKILLKRKYEVLGYGAYSIAFKAKNSDRVIKIGSTLADPWLLYAQKVMSLDNSYYPRIHNIKIYEYKDYYVAETELLSPVDIGSKEYKEFIESMRNNQFNCKQAREAMSLIDNLLSKLDYARKDLHFNNIMLRGKDIVLNDPIAENDIESDFEAWLEETFSSEFYSESLCTSM